MCVELLHIYIETFVASFLRTDVKLYFGIYIYIYQRVAITPRMKQLPARKQQVSLVGKCTLLLYSLRISCVGGDIYDG
jgi:hypothetical protein